MLVSIGLEAPIIPELSVHRTLESMVRHQRHTLSGPARAPIAALEEAE